MKFLVLFTTLLLLHFGNAAKKSICQKKGIKCLDDSTFMICQKKSQKIDSIENGYKCPEQYLCQEDSNTPCVAGPDVISECPQTSCLNSQEEVEEEEPLTTVNSDDIITIDEDWYKTTPVDDLTESTQKPFLELCKGSETTDEKFPSPLCTHYVQCKKIINLIQFPTLVACPSNQKFSAEDGACVPENESNCEDNLKFGGGAFKSF